MRGPQVRVAGVLVALTGISFRKSTQLQPPRTVRVGFRFEF